MTGYSQETQHDSSQSAENFSRTHKAEHNFGLDPRVQVILNKLHNFYEGFFSQITKAQPDPLNIFSPQIIGKTFTQAHKVMVNKFLVEPEDWDTQQQQHLKNLEELYQRTLTKLHGEEVEPIITPHHNDRRFKANEWEEFPAFDYIKQSYLLHTKYITDLIDSLEGIQPKAKEKIQFYTRNLMNALSPTNFPMTNPEVLKETIRTKGDNLVKGYKRLLDDKVKNGFLSLSLFTDLQAFKVGKNLAITPGKVIYETELFQLLYFKPTTKEVHEVPLLILPPWINKYYIFDLTQDKSFIKWLVGQGYSVFVVSWINPDESYANYSLEDYVLKGALKAVQHVLKTTQQKQLNLLSYCTGGVAAVLLAAYLEKKYKKNKNPLKSLTLLATPIDFQKMGDLKVFVCEEQLQHLEEHVQKLGYLPGDVMTRVFSLLRSNDLIWSNYVNTYLLNKDPYPMDFLFWNCDTTHVPATMHMEYLRHIFYENALMHPHTYTINNVGIDLHNISIPIFAFATKSDHIVPWESAFAIKEFCKDNTTFVLGAAGHVAGIINPVESKKYCFWKAKKHTYKMFNAEEWFHNTKETKGSWWPEWKNWLSPLSGKKVKTNLWKDTPHLEKAPGRYVTASNTNYK